jgi:hypothetical protein
VNLTPKAAEKVAREAARLSFDEAARSLSIDWKRELDGKQIQRWADAIGRQVLQRQDKQLAAMAQGQLPACRKNQTELLVIGMDGGRVQTLEKDPVTGSRWREDKVLTVSSCLLGRKGEPPQKLVTTRLATMGDVREFAPLCRLEAERRGIRQAADVVVIGDGGCWIDTIADEQFPRQLRIIDFFHASERLHACAKAALGGATPRSLAEGRHLSKLLRRGKLKEVLSQIQQWSQNAGPPPPTDPLNSPRRVLAANVGYFQRHGEQMNYPRYRRLGYPIGSGITESGVKQFNKRVKGTDQLWNKKDVEPILALRGLWISEDGRWDDYWLCRPSLN